MANGIPFLIILLFCTFVTALQDNTTDYDYEDDYYDDTEPTKDLGDKAELSTISTKTFTDIKIGKATEKVPKAPKLKRDREELTTEKQFAKYEVTELVIDIPDTNTQRVPILTNFTFTRPLNFAGVPKNKINNTNININDEGDEIINTIFAPDKPNYSDEPNDSDKPNDSNEQENGKGRNINFNLNKEDNSFFSDFNPKSVFDEELDEDDDEFDEFNFDIEPKTKDFKDYLYNVKKHIDTGLESAINKHKEDINHSLHKLVNGPITFLSKLHKKTSELAKKIHNAVSRHKCHSDDDDEHDHDFDED